MKPRHKRLVLFIAIVFFSVWLVRGQATPTFQIVQDAKLAFVGDDKGNEAFTPNVIVRMSLDGYDKPTGFSSVIAEYEYAGLVGGEYHRWSAGYGHNVNLNRFTLTGSAQFGFIARPGATMTGVFTGDLAYYVTDNLAIVGSTQGTIRSDLKNSPFRVSNFIGIRWKFKTNRRNDILRRG